MKTVLVMIILCCNAQTDNGYKYEAKNLTTNQTGTLFSEVKYDVGDTIRIESYGK